MALAVVTLAHCSLGARDHEFESEGHLPSTTTRKTRIASWWVSLLKKEITVYYLLEEYLYLLQSLLFPFFSSFQFCDGIKNLTIFYRNLRKLARKTNFSKIFPILCRENDKLVWKNKKTLNFHDYHGPAKVISFDEHRPTPGKWTITLPRQEAQFFFFFARK